MGQATAVRMSSESRRTPCLSAIVDAFESRIALAFCTILMQCAALGNVVHHCLSGRRAGITLFVLWLLIPGVVATKAPNDDVWPTPGAVFPCDPCRLPAAQTRRFLAPALPGNPIGMTIQLTLQGVKYVQNLLVLDLLPFLNKAPRQMILGPFCQLHC